MLVLSYEETSQRITCPHRDVAVPAGDVTITITDDAGSSLLSSTAATKGSLSSTIATAVSAGARQITVADASGVSAGDPIVLTDDYGRTETAIADGAETTTDVIQIRAPLERSYAVGDAVASALIYYDADISDTDDFSKGSYYQAIFDCSTWGGARAVLFRVLDLQSYNPIDLRHITRWAPQVMQLRDADDGEGFANERDASWDIICTRMRSVGRDPDVWRDADDAASVAGLLAAGLVLLNHGMLDQSELLIGNPPGEGGTFAQLWRDFASSVGWFDEDQDRKVDGFERRKPMPSYLGRGL